jgi:hypothetical protein
MNKWLKIITPAVLAAIAITFILMFSGLGTSTVMDSYGNPVTSTVINHIDVNGFAAVMIAGVSLVVLISSYLLEKTSKSSS